MISAIATPEGNDVIAQIIGILVGGGVIGGVVNLILGRNKPKVDRGQLRVAEATAEGEFQRRIMDRLTAVEQRLDESETRERAQAALIRTLWDDIDELEAHIQAGLGPPPPRGRRNEVKT